MQMREQIHSLILENTEVFDSAFLKIPVTAERKQQAEQELGFAIPESYLWFLETYGHGGCFFELLGFGLSGTALFVQETKRQREKGLPAQLMVIENCDEYVVCIDSQNSNIVSWSSYDQKGTIFKFSCFEEYFLDVLENAIENFDDEEF